MKLLTFSKDSRSDQLFGVVINERVFSFDSIQAKFGTHHSALQDIYSYLHDLPESQLVGQELVSRLKTEAAIDSIGSFGLEEITIHPPVPNPPALIDLGLTPRHLKNSARTLLKHEFHPFLARIIRSFLNRKMDKMAQSPILMYYKGNHNAVSGHGQTLHWPSYTSYLDIEPELAIVCGNEKQPIAGYTILNDVSARDIQFPEMMGTGPARSKDFDRGNGLGPFLVTPDEVGDPLDLKVTAMIGSRFEWHGNTSEHSRTPEEAIAFIQRVFTIKPGTILGMGSIPDCTGLDNDLWIQPGDTIEISIEKLGSLKQFVPDKIDTLENSRWKNRPELAEFYTTE